SAFQLPLAPASQPPLPIAANCSMAARGDCTASFFKRSCWAFGSASFAAQGRPPKNCISVGPAPTGTRRGPGAAMAADNLLARPGRAASISACEPETLSGGPTAVFPGIFHRETVRVLLLGVPLIWVVATWLTPNFFARVTASAAVQRKS